MRQIEFFVSMDPVAQGRPRFSTACGYARAYDPKKSREAKSYLQLAAAEAMGQEVPLEGALRLWIVVYRPAPKSVSQKKLREMLGGKIMPTTKPDASNYQKLVEDALNGIVWRDDSQLVETRCIKRYGEKPGYKIQVTEYLPEEESLFSGGNWTEESREAHVQIKR